MEALEAIRTRRTVERFSKKPVEFDKVMAVCEAGGMAPSAGNLQPWKFVVLTDKDVIRNDLASCCLDQECVQTAQVAIVVVADEDLVERHYGLRGKRLYSIQNCAAAIQNMLLTAHVLGLGATWVGAFNEERLDDIIDIRDGARAQAVITLGYPAEQPSDKRMRHLDDIVRFGNYHGRFKDMHRILRDLSLEWEKRAEDAKERLEEPTKSFINKCKNVLKKGKDMVKDKGGED